MLQIILDPEHKSALVLVFLAFPGHLVFYYTISEIKKVNHEHSYNPATTTATFISFYLIVSTLQVREKHFKKVIYYLFTKFFVFQIGGYAVSDLLLAGSLLLGTK